MSHQLKKTLCLFFFWQFCFAFSSISFNGEAHDESRLLDFSSPLSSIGNRRLFFLRFFQLWRQVILSCGYSNWIWWCCWWLVLSLLSLSLISLSFTRRAEPDDHQKEITEGWFRPVAAELRLQPGKTVRDLAVPDLVTLRSVAGGWWRFGRGTARLSSKDVFVFQHGIILAEPRTAASSQLARRLQSPHALQPQLQ